MGNILLLGCANIRALKEAFREFVVPSKENYFKFREFIINEAMENEPFTRKTVLNHMSKVRKMKQLLTGNTFHNLQIVVMREGKSFVAILPALDLVTQGDTLDEAAKNAGEAASLFIEECREHGTLDQVLVNLGWKRKTIHNRKSFTPPEVVAQLSQSVAIPA